MWRRALKLLKTSKRRASSARSVAISEHGMSGMIPSMYWETCRVTPIHRCNTYQPYIKATLVASITEFLFIMPLQYDKAPPPLLETLTSPLINSNYFPLVALISHLVEIFRDQNGNKRCKEVLRGIDATNGIVPQKRHTYRMMGFREGTDWQDNSQLADWRVLRVIDDGFFRISCWLRVSLHFKASCIKLGHQSI